MKKPGHVYQFNLRLLGVAPPIWRRVQVPETYSFRDLHVALQDSMGWLVIAQYDYDFGDGWEHELTLEAILPQEPRKKYPRCVAGARSCPPEDCGDIGGYENLVRVIQTPTHKEYESIRQWLGGRFDPEAFESSHVKFDDPARRYELAFEEPRRGRPRWRRKTRPDNIRLKRSSARRARR